MKQLPLLENVFNVQFILHVPLEINPHTFIFQVLFFKNI